MQANFHEEQKFGYIQDQNLENEWINYQKNQKDSVVIKNYNNLSTNIKNFKKKKVIDPEMIKTGHWTSEEHKKYMDFLMDHKDQTVENLLKNKNNKIFKMMSSVIGTRTPSQCRSHHQKFNPFQNLCKKRIKRQHKGKSNQMVCLYDQKQCKKPKEENTFPNNYYQIYGPDYGQYLNQNLVGEQQQIQFMPHPFSDVQLVPIPLQFWPFELPQNIFALPQMEQQAQQEVDLNQEVKAQKYYPEDFSGRGIQNIENTYN